VLLHWFWLGLSLSNWCKTDVVLPTDIIRDWLNADDVWTDFDAKSFLFVAAAAAYSQLLCGLLGKYLLVSELPNAHIVRQVFFRLQFSAAESWMAVWVLRGSLFTQILSMTVSWRHISQGRAATHLWYGENFTYHFIENLSQSPIMNKFWKSVKINLSQSPIMNKFWKSVKIW